MGMYMNIVQSAVLVGGMVLLFCLLGASLAGVDGLVVLGVIGIVSVVASARVSPHLVLRLYGAQPLTRSNAARLVELLVELGRRAGLPATPRLVYIPSRLVTAFTVGTRSASVIGVTDGILRTLDPRELIGVLAHEVSHLRRNDVWVMGLADMISRTTGVLSWLGQFLLLVNLPLILMGGVTIPWMFIVLLIFAPTLTALLQLALSRTREYDADMGAVDLTDDPRGLASALVKLERMNAGLFERVLLPGRRIPEPSLLRTHPRTEDRVRRLLDLDERSRDPTADGLGDDRSRVQVAPGPGEIRTPRWHFSGLWY